MFVKENRSGLIIYLYYNRDAKKLANYGDTSYHSKNIVRPTTLFKQKK